MSAVTRTEDGMQIDAELLAGAFGVPAAAVPDLMRDGAITSRMEKGVEEDEGRFRLLFFYRSTRLTLIVDERGEVLRQSVLTFPEGVPAAALRRG